MSTLCLYSYLQEKSGLSETVVNNVKDVRRVFLTFFFNGIFFLSVYVLFHAFFIPICKKIRWVSETVVKDVQDARRVFLTELRTLRNVRRGRKRRTTDAKERTLRVVTIFALWWWRKQKFRQGRRKGDDSVWHLAIAWCCLLSICEVVVGLLFGLYWDGRKKSERQKADKWTRYSVYHNRW